MTVVKVVISFDHTRVAKMTWTLQEKVIFLDFKQF